MKAAALPQPAEEGQLVFVSSFIRKGKMNIDNCSRKMDMLAGKNYG
ncbi:hypothetical protein [Paenibacillus tianjinensis]|uniref:Uncharacterized protein n=1 Tax=Paenibacillus tianjinensis TaxID=2810347 RepID=A0ABX7LHZ3_9BACL|nr:hypothetical protein [Paenibacillus tianjinensis]QSF46574.1 hypothetical protein JRJ22_08395 [Paenibacillus tianjinensis]